MADRVAVLPRDCLAGLVPGGQGQDDPGRDVLGNLDGADSLGADTGCKDPGQGCLAVVHCSLPGCTP